MTIAGRGSVRAGSPTALPTNTEILVQLDRIRLSAEFDVPDRARKFLAYIVGETIAGRADRIKAYSIATEVFGRDSSFDAQTDPVVRIEAGRIRRALERYYFVAGSNDPIVIKIPKGGYAPAFEKRDGAPYPLSSGQAANVQSRSIPLEQTALWVSVATVGLLTCGLLANAFFGSAATTIESLTKPGGTRPNIPKLMVMPFEDLSQTPQSAMITRGLTDEVISNIAKFKEIVVVAGPAAPNSHSAEREYPAFALEGRVRLDGDKLRLGIRLVQHTDGSVVWANTYDEVLQPRKIIELQQNAAAAVASAIAQPYGIVFQANATHFMRSVPDDWQAYACTLAYYGYRGDLNPQTHASVQECLQRATTQFPDYATAWALLSLTYVDELRFRYRLNRSTTVSLAHAIEAAARAVELDPQNVRALQAEMLTLFFRGEVNAALTVGARAYAINPNDTEFSGEYGFRLALSGQWRSGCDLVSKTVASNPGPVGYFEAALAVCCYIEHDYVAAERWARSADLHANPVYHVILLAILGKLGKMDLARTEREWLETNVPGFLENARNEVALRIHRPEDQQHFIEGLRQAGVPIPGK
ncbi:hypothetical protein GOB07_16085 [Sinorhizobium meliloti]|uniref:integral membrane protein n=1 Tax=Rhizobium meliloti TaxID=382 RepID=UPI0004F83D38|nr:integral membrane protein [Sinorhizobium meliloti]AIM02274.1 hypothetical protein DU99_23935 [Sinorhizobium meliloti]ASQ02007.1 hypothetical protein CDO24_32750 [Sinorhizobium meliloti]ASQ12774.1 hypothetical protein CDO22_22395 [Sinorhizobium meliloti]MDW9365361.1 hypothetical protein [Sinorhizobium meliloti]MDW9367456.1 hypothetical protein [Sinorhizobium meliloti]